MAIPDLGWWFGQGLNLRHSLNKSEPNELTGQQLQIINSSKGDMKLDNIKSSYQCQGCHFGLEAVEFPSNKKCDPQLHS